MKIELSITGNRPMIQHNGRMANPLDPYVRELKKYTSKRKKTDEDLARIMQIESRGACWETEEHILGLPNAAVWRCIFDTAKAFRRGEDVKRALLFVEEVVPLFVDGKEVKCDDFVSVLENVDYRPVKIAGKKTMRARPIIRNWSATVQFELLDDVIDLRDFETILERAKRLTGLAEWRPAYGTFEVEVREI